MNESAAATQEGVEHEARSALRWGSAGVVLGLAAVGVGAADDGAVVALAGLLVLIYGIHRFGRLGPERVGAALQRSASTVDAMWTGGLLLVASLAVLLGSPHVGTPSYAAYAGMLGGTLRLAAGYREGQKIQQAQPRVEKRRRMSKSRAP